MPTDDFSGFRRRYENALDRLADSDTVHDADRTAIRQWLRARDGDLAVSSCAQYVNRLRILSERSDTPLVDLDIDGVRDLCFELRRDDSLGRGGTPSDATVYNYQAALSSFASHRDDDWVDDFDPDKPSDQTVTEDEILTQSEIARLVAAAKRPRNQALVEFLADTGARLTLAGSLRVADVDLEGDRATYRPNPDAIGLKGATGKPYPIIDSTASLRVYLQHSHPRPDEPEAALFHRFENYGNIDDDDGSLSPDRVRAVLRNLADRAGIDTPTNPHNFRHAAITRMWREGWNRQDIQHRVQWTLDTDMWQRYVHVTAEEMNDQIFAAAGVGESDNALSQERLPCPQCRETIPPHAEYCPRCGEAVTQDASETKTDAIDSLSSALEDLDDADRRRVVGAMLRSINERPEMLKRHESSSESRF